MTTPTTRAAIPKDNEEEKQKKRLKFETGKYKQVLGDFRYHWEEGRKAASKAGEDLNEMVRLIRKEYPDWSFSKIVKKIWIDNEDLEGFTRNTIRKYLDASNVRLLGLTNNSDTELEEEKDSSTTNLHNKSGQGCPQNSYNNNTEQSSITTPSNDDNNNNNNNNVYTTTTPLPIPTEEIKSFNQEESSIKVRQLNQQLEDAHKIIQELEERVQQLSLKKMGTVEDKFNFEYDFELPNGEIVPFIVTVFPDKKTGYIRLNKNRVKK